MRPCINAYVGVCVGLAVMRTIVSAVCVYACVQFMYVFNEYIKNACPHTSPFRLDSRKQTTISDIGYHNIYLLLNQ